MWIVQILQVRASHILRLTISKIIGFFW
jgi:ABC-type multidrug transport system fused ATPase/permease subunit